MEIVCTLINLWILTALKSKFDIGLKLGHGPSSKMTDTAEAEATKIANKVNRSILYWNKCTKSLLAYSTKDTTSLNDVLRSHSFYTKFWLEVINELFIHNLLVNRIVFDIFPIQINFYFWILTYNIYLTIKLVVNYSFSYMDIFRNIFGLK